MYSTISKQATDKKESERNEFTKVRSNLTNRISLNVESTDFDEKWKTVNIMYLEKSIYKGFFHAVSHFYSLKLRKHGLDECMIKLFKNHLNH